MDKIYRAYQEGKVVYVNSNEPRYYKKIDGKLHYSDNLKTWKSSNGSEEMFLDKSDWRIKN